MALQVGLHLVVVTQHPTKAYRVLVCDPVPEFRLGWQHAELGFVIPVLKTVLVEPHLDIELLKLFQNLDIPRQYLVRRLVILLLL